MSQVHSTHNGHNVIVMDTKNDDHVITHQPAHPDLNEKAYQLDWQGRNTTSALYHVQGPPSNQGGQLTQLNYSELSIRAGFFRKVFALLFCMLTFVTAFIALFLFQPSCKHFVQTHAGVFYASIPICLITFIVVLAWKQARHRYPYNIISLILVTLSMGYATATISSFFDVTIVFTSLAICVVSCLAISLFNIQTKYDFGSWIGVLFTIVIVGLLVAITCIFCHVTYNQSQANLAAYAGIITLVLMTVFTLGVNKSLRDFNGNDYEEHIATAIVLFASIIGIFLAVLVIIGFIAMTGKDGCNCSGGDNCFCYLYCCDCCCETRKKQQTEPDLEEPQHPKRTTEMPEQKF